MIRAVDLKHENKVLRGYLQCPDAPGKYPALILCHGFTGSKEEIHMMFVKFCRILESMGWASLRFDFSGTGDSDGDFSDMTFGSELSEANAILDYAKSLPEIDPDRIALLGQSMGGAVVSALAGKRPDDVSALVLWAGAGELKDAILQVFEASNIKGSFDGSQDIDCYGYCTGKAFLRELQTLDVFAQAKGYHGPVLFVRGTADVIVKASSEAKYAEIYGDNMKIVHVEGASHVFDTLNHEQQAFKAAADFLAAL